MRVIRPAVAGILAAAAGVAVAELLAAVVLFATGRAGSSPVVAVGGAVIDATPTPVKEFAVRTFGTFDKPLLLGGIGLALVAYAAVVGLLARRRPVIGWVGTALFGVAGAAAATSRPDGQPTDALPTIVGAVVAAFALWWLNGHRRAERATQPATEPASRTAAEPVAVGTGGRAMAGSAPAAGPTGRGSAANSTGGESAANRGAGGLGAGGAGAGGPGADEPPGGGSAGGGSTGNGPPRGWGPGRWSAPHPLGGNEPSRRQFVSAAAGLAAGAAVVGGSAVAVRAASSRNAARSREAVRLPAPAEPAPALPSGVDKGFVTANADFFRVDTALTVPRIDADTWRLTIGGMVDRPREVSFKELLGRPLIERDITLNCVSNEVGGPYVGTARWLGAPLAALLTEAGIRPGADQLVARSAEGMTIGTPIETIMDGRDAMLAVGMNGEALPLVNGFPVRMLTPGLYGYAGSCKWLVELEVSTFAEFDAYWVRRGWAAEAPVKTASRIDRPAPFAALPAGKTTIAGVAWAQRRGISAVQVRVDEEDWRDAELLPAPESTDTWVQWRLAWIAKSGAHTLRVRAVDGRGDAQTDARAAPFPSGATGWHTVAVTVR